MRPKEKEDIADMVKEEVLKTQECQQNYYGLEDKEFLEDY
jgi:hypothetical protein